MALQLTGAANKNTLANLQVQLPAVVIGGGSLNGGEGSILGSMIGALIMAFLRNGCQQVGWPNYVQEIIIGTNSMSTSDWREMAIFSRQFATLIGSGMPMLRSLYTLEEQTDDKVLAAVITQLREDVEAGLLLSQAMARHEKVFSRLYVAMVEAGELGQLRVVQAEYPQDWLTEKIEDTGQKQAVWRNDPKRAGAGGCLGDIGTHAYNLACFVTGLELDSLSADLTSFVKGRKLDDNVHVMMRFKGGAKGMLWASQVAPGNENNLKVRVYGTKGGLEWWQEHPNQLIWSPHNKPSQIISRGTPGANAAAARVTRVPPGHPEGYLEGFANIYTEVAAAIRAARSKRKLDTAVSFPTVEDGVRGIAFIEAAVKSSAKDGKWVKMSRAVHFEFSVRHAHH